MVRLQTIPLTHAEGRGGHKGKRGKGQGTVSAPMPVRPFVSTVGGSPSVGTAAEATGNNAVRSEVNNGHSSESTQSERAKKKQKPNKQNKPVLTDKTAFQKIFEFLKCKRGDRGGGSMSVQGASGCGKTFTIELAVGEANAYLGEQTYQIAKIDNSIVYEQDNKFALLETLKEVVFSRRKFCIIVAVDTLSKDSINCVARCLNEVDTVNEQGRRRETNPIICETTASTQYGSELLKQCSKKVVIQPTVDGLEGIALTRLYDDARIQRQDFLKALKLLAKKSCKTGDVSAFLHEIEILQKERAEDYKDDYEKYTGALFAKDSNVKLFNSIISIMSGNVVRKDLFNMVEKMDPSLLVLGCTTNVNHFAPGMYTSPRPQMQTVLELNTWANGMEALSQAHFLKDNVYSNYSNDKLILLDYAAWTCLYSVCGEKFKLCWKKNAIHSTTLMGLKHSKTFPTPPKMEHNFLGRHMTTQQDPPSCRKSRKLK